MSVYRELFDAILKQKKIKCNSSTNGSSWECLFWLLSLIVTWLNPYMLTEEGKEH